MVKTKDEERTTGCRLTVTLAVAIADELRPMAAELERAPSTLAGQMVADCIAGCKAKQAGIPEVVTLYRKLHRKGIDIERAVGQWALKSAFPEWGQKSDLWLEMLGRMVESRMREGEAFSEATPFDLAHKALENEAEFEKLKGGRSA